MGIVRTDVSGECDASIIRVNGISILFTANVPNSLILFILMMERHVPLKRQFLQEPHGVTSQKTAIFIEVDL
jgi:hypothetical protein